RLSEQIVRLRSEPTAEIGVRHAAEVQVARLEERFAYLEAARDAEERAAEAELKRLTAELQRSREQTQAAQREVGRLNVALERANRDSSMEESIAALETEVAAAQ